MLKFCTFNLICKNNKVSTEPIITPMLSRQAINSVLITLLTLCSRLRNIITLGLRFIKFSCRIETYLCK
jgi:hypothetical protein